MSKGFASTYRIVLVAAGMMAGFSALGARLVYLHVIDREELVRYVDKARRQIIVESARRGDILDARGKILASSRSLIVLGVAPQSLRPEDEKKWPRLAALLGMSPDELSRIFLTKYRTATPAAPAPATPAANQGLVITFSADRAAAVTAPLAAPAPAPAAATATPADDRQPLGFCHGTCRDTPVLRRRHAVPALPIQSRAGCNCTDTPARPRAVAPVPPHNGPCVRFGHMVKRRRRCRAPRPSPTPASAGRQAPAQQTAV